MIRKSPDKRIFAKINFENFLYLKIKDSGKWQSNLIGEGIEFDSLREYQNGDSTKKINWAATARASNLIINQTTSTKTLNLHVIIDANITQNFGSNIRKSQIINELLHTLVEIASYNQDGIKFTVLSEKTQSHPLKNGKRSLVFYKNVIEKIKYDRVSKINYYDIIFDKNKFITFFITDFIDSEEKNNILKIIKSCNPIIVTVNDPVEFSLPNIGIFEIKNIKNNDHIIIDTNDNKFIDQYKKRLQEYNNERKNLAKNSKKMIELSTEGAHGGEQFIRKFIKG